MQIAVMLSANSLFGRCVTFIKMRKPKRLMATAMNGIKNGGEAKTE